MGWSVEIEILVRIRYPREMLARVCAQQFLIGGRAWFAPLPVTVPTLQKRYGPYNPLRLLRMTGPAVLVATWVVKNLHAILLARFHRRDKLRLIVIPGPIEMMERMPLVVHKASPAASALLKRRCGCNMDRPSSNSMTARSSSPGIRQPMKPHVTAGFFVGAQRRMA